MKTLNVYLTSPLLWIIQMGKLYYVHDLIRLKLQYDVLDIKKVLLHWEIQLHLVLHFFSVFSRMHLLLKQLHLQMSNIYVYKQTHTQIHKSKIIPTLLINIFYQISYMLSFIVSSICCYSYIYVISCCSYYLSVRCI